MVSNLLSMGSESERGLSLNAPLFVAVCQSVT